MKNKLVFLFVSLAVIILLILIPTGFEDAIQFKVLVTEVDNSSLIDTGLIRTGQQVCKVKFLSGRFKGREAEGWNMLSGSLTQGTPLYNILNNNVCIFTILNFMGKKQSE